MTFHRYVQLADVVESVEADCEEFNISDQILDLEIELEFDLIIHDMGRPAVMYLSNGDPGYPEEGPEYEIELLSDLGRLLSCAVSNRISTLFQKFIPEWVDNNYETIAGEAFESFIQNHEE